MSPPGPIAVDQDDMKNDTALHRRSALLSMANSFLLAGLIIVAAVAMFVREPRKAIGVAAAFCLVVGVLWLCDALRGLWHEQ